jgi:hypothetical protein
LPGRRAESSRQTGRCSAGELLRCIDHGGLQSMQRGSAPGRRFRALARRPPRDGSRPRLKRPAAPPPAAHPSPRSYHGWRFDAEGKCRWARPRSQAAPGWSSQAPAHRTAQPKQRLDPHTCLPLSGGRNSGAPGGPRRRIRTRMRAPPPPRHAAAGTSPRSRIQRRAPPPAAAPAPASGRSPARWGPPDRRRSRRRRCRHLAAAPPPSPAAAGWRRRLRPWRGADCARLTAGSACCKAQPVSCECGAHDSREVSQLAPTNQLPH